MKNLYQSKIAVTTRSLRCKANEAEKSDNEGSLSHQEEKTPFKMVFEKDENGLHLIKCIVANDQLGEVNIKDAPVPLA